ncbi:MAG: hypothetical protein OEU26_27955 [Candidatus Tectomicrobia bacterium]|nr:hypothetical protein [Candidatus Tectomicrobia bacterium]
MAAVDDLITTLGQNVETGLGQFQRLEAEGKIRPGIFGPRELLCKLTWWHQVAAEAMESVGSGGDPYRIYASDDEMDLRAVTRNTGKTVAQLSEAVLSHQSRIAAAASKIADPNAAIFVHEDGTEDSVPKRLEATAQRWKASIEELQNQ